MRDGPTADGGRREPAPGPSGPPPQNPYGPPAPYGQPGPYDQPGPYGQPGADPRYPGWAQQYPQQYPQPAPKSTHTGLFVGLGVGAVVLVALAAMLLTGNDAGSQQAAGSSATAAAGVAGAQSASPATPTTSAAAAVANLVVPTTAGPLTQMTGAAADKIVTAMKTADAGNAMLSTAQFAAYRRTTGSAFVTDLTLVSMANIPAIDQELPTEGATALAREIATGAGLTGIQQESAGTLGGAMCCGEKKGTAIGTMQICDWVDAASFALTASDYVTTAEAATYTAALRQAAEQ